jgi:acetoin utilization protein AcuB
MSSRHPIRDFMSADFVTVRPDTPVPAASVLMRSTQMRDLVVTDGDRLVGVVSQLDLYLIRTLSGADPEGAIVEEAMAAQPYIVGPDASLEEVARTMWKDRCGSAVVIDQEQVIGLFTIFDALEALSRVLATEGEQELAPLHHSDGPTLH